MISSRCPVECRAGARELRRLQCDVQRSRTIARALVAVVAEQARFRRARAASRSRRAGQRRSSRSVIDDPARTRRAAVKRDAERAQAFAARVEILDQLRGGKADAERHEAAERGPEHACPSESAARHAGVSTGTGRCRSLGLRHDPHRAARGLPASSASTTITAGSSRRNVAGRGLWIDVHASRSPIRNCSARSRRMWGSVGSRRRALARGGRKRRKRKSVVLGRRSVRPLKPSVEQRGGIVRQVAGKRRDLRLAVEHLATGRLARERRAGDGGSLSRPRATVASRVARTAASATTSTSAPENFARATRARSCARGSASSRSWLG